MKLSEIRQALSAHGIRLTKSLGQNFLHDDNQLRRIVAAADLTPTDKVLEIGPGLGSLTERLLARAGEVLAIEKDHRLAEWLERRFNRAGALALRRDDALKLLRRERRDWGDWKLVANLPYSVASPILVELAASDPPPQRLVATLQWEVVRRLVAAPGTPDYGVLTLLIQLRYEPRGWFKIPRSCFFPAPEVDSACVTLIRRRPTFLDPRESEGFTGLVKRAFSQRRKQMFKLLKEDWPEPALEESFGRLGISPIARAETISVLRFVELTRLLQRLCPKKSLTSSTTATK